MTNAESEPQPGLPIAGDQLAPVLGDLVKIIHEHLAERWDRYLHGASLALAGEVIAGLICRQCELAIAFAESPVLWRVSVAPVLLRTMIETHINLAWILLDPEDRAEKFVDYGLGQAKLLIRRRQEHLEKSGIDPDEDPTHVAQSAWLESQRLMMLTEVNVGSWSGKSTRALAQEADQRRLYDLAYEPFSSAVHSHWHHIGRLNLINCSNPFHGLHRVPVIVEGEHLHHLSLAAKYLTLSLEGFDRWSGFHLDRPYPLEWLDEALTQAVARGEPKSEHGDTEG